MANTKPKSRRWSATFDAESVKWQTPTPAYARQNRRSIAAFVEVLKTRPNEWAVYRTDAPNCGITTYGKERYSKTEWTSRSNGDGTFTIFARFIGK